MLLSNHGGGRRSCEASFCGGIQRGIRIVRRRSIHAHLRSAVFRFVSYKARPLLSLYAHRFRGNRDRCRRRGRLHLRAAKVCRHRMGDCGWTDSALDCACVDIHQPLGKSDGGARRRRLNGGAARSLVATPAGARCFRAIAHLQCNRRLFGTQCERRWLQLLHRERLLMPAGLPELRVQPDDRRGNLLRPQFTRMCRPAANVVLSAGDELLRHRGTMLRRRLVCCSRLDFRGCALRRELQL